MRWINYLTIILLGCVLMVTSCKKTSDIDEEVKRMKAKADEEIVMAQDEIDKQFEKLFSARKQLEEIEKRASQFKKGTSDYILAEREVEEKRKNQQDAIEALNDRYYSLIGFHLTEVNSNEEYKNANELIKSRIALEINEKYEQMALDMVNGKYDERPGEY